MIKANYYNNRRCHESLNKVNPADIYFGIQEQILQWRGIIKIRSMMVRRVVYFNTLLVLFFSPPGTTMLS
jgi:hypothetical protein